MNDKNLAELKTYLDGRFKEQNRELKAYVDDRFKEQNRGLDKRFAVVDARFDEQRAYMDSRFDAMQKQMNDRFDAQRNYLEARFDIVDRDLRELRANVTDMHEKFSVLQSAVDHYVLRAEVLAEEQAVIKHQMTRFEQHLKLVAEKVGVELDYA
jgi:ABC-type phosphate transport system auxiliary subunit